MSQKDTQRQRLDFMASEDKDFYLFFLNKKLRNMRKKLEQIDDLMKRDQKSLKPEQLGKISSKAEVTQNVEHYEKLKEIYYNAYKFAVEEGRIPNQERSMDQNTQRQQHNIDAMDNNKPVQYIPDRKEGVIPTEDQLLKNALTKIVNLVFSSQIIEDPLKRQALVRTNEKEESHLDQEEVIKVQQFCQLVLAPSQNKDGLKIEDKIKESVESLLLYIKAEDDAILPHKTHRNLQQTVEKIIHTSSSINTSSSIDFRSDKASPQKMIENRSNTDSNLKDERQTLQSSFHESSEQELQVIAAAVQPDFDDSSRSPEKTEFTAPKEVRVVRFVDEIEKGMQNQPKEVSGHSKNPHEGRGSILKDSKHIIDHDKDTIDNTKVESQGGEEVEEQRSFRRKTFNNEQEFNNKSRYDTKVTPQQSNKYTNSWTNRQNRQNTDYEQANYKNAGAYKRDKYESNDYNKAGAKNNQYQYRQYVEKKSYESKN